ncbi:replication restart DNA helicase PriA [Lentzea atacamensis]|uniref:Probable replication restart protein PriA n=1 Tax=Lentzea atacamensis TaxID=531938 RepID=A0ABX9E1D8_9PSEU|nr:replication restart DNA helicase PriA [Lentzea atacamensis]
MLPVARIVVDVPLAHLDRPFDYAVPSELDEAAVPGCRVRVRFAGQLVDGYLLERAETSDYEKKLAFIEKVVSPEPVLTPEIAALARAIADRYAGGMIDVLRLAIPPRHARAEAAAPSAPAPLPQVPAWVSQQQVGASSDAAADSAPATAAAVGSDSAAPAAELEPATPSVELESSAPSAESASSAPSANSGSAAPAAEPASATPSVDLASAVRSASVAPSAESASTAPSAHSTSAAAPAGDSVTFAEPSSAAALAGDAVTSAKPIAPAAGPTVSTAALSAPVTEPVAPATAPAAPSVERTARAAESAAPTAESAAPTAGPVSPTAGAIASGVEPVPAGAEPTAPTAGPVSPTAGSAAPGAESVPAGAESVPAGAEPASAGGVAPPARSQLPPVPADAWSRYPRGPKYLEALRSGLPAHAVWQALPSEDWPARLAEAAAAVASTGRGVVIVVPDHRDLARVSEACDRLIEGVVTLSADLGPSERYKRWLAVRRGIARVVVGTRATAFAPVRDPGLLVVWDDGDDLHVEPRSPYPNVRDVLVQRAHMSGAALLIGGFARTAEAQLLVETGWAHEIVASRETLRAVAPRVVSVGDNEWQEVKDPAARTARLPSIAFDAARFALTDSPVLIQVPRRGYVPALACGQCRGPARCRRCAGPLALPGGTEDGMPKPAYCRWCAATEAGFRCPTCGSRRLRGQVIGARRTAEELGRAFPGYPVRTSGADEVLTKVPGRPSLVVATPGAEPVAEGGYGAVLLLDGWALLGRADLRASEEALRRWMTAAGLVRPGNGRVVVIADSGLTPVQALVRWDPVWHAATELAARTELGFPPAVRMATIDGTPDAVNALLDELRLPPTGEILGPVPLGDDETKERALVRVARSEGRQLAAVLAEAQAVRTARKEQELVRIKLDPLEVL